MPTDKILVIIIKRCRGDLALSKAIRINEGDLLKDLFHAVAARRSQVTQEATLDREHAKITPSTNKLSYHAPSPRRPGGTYEEDAVPRSASRFRAGGGGCGGAWSSRKDGAGGGF